MSGSGRETFPYIREALPNIREWSEDPRRCPGVVGIPTRISGVVGRPSRMAGSAREALLDHQKWSGGLLVDR